MTPVRTATKMLVLIVGLSACSGDDGVSPGVGSAPDPSKPALHHPATVELPAMVEEVLGPFHGDFDAMVEKREIRVLVTDNMTNFFLDGGTQRGITADALREFEKSLNKELKLGRRRLQVTAIPVVRDQLLPFLEAGRDDLAVATGRNLGWAMRKDATGLEEHVNRFVKANRTGRLLGNTLIKRYLGETKYIENAFAGEERGRLGELIAIFRKYGDLYHFDPLMLAAQAYQESRLDQSVVSRAGAVGIMQILPTTAAGKEVGIPDVSTIDSNIHAGTKYLRHIIDHYFDDPTVDKLNRSLFAFASYNAGPSRIKSLRAEAAARGYDPNVWFFSVEVVVSDEVGREPVQYVRNIFKYYTAYSLLSGQDEIRQWLMSEGLAHD